VGTKFTDCLVTVPACSRDARTSAAMAFIVAGKTLAGLFLFARKVSLEIDLLKAKSLSCLVLCTRPAGISVRSVIINGTMTGSMTLSIGQV
jgi:hypothetical protein